MEKVLVDAWKINHPQWGEREARGQRRFIMFNFFLSSLNVSFTSTIDSIFPWSKPKIHMLFCQYYSNLFYSGDIVVVCGSPLSSPYHVFEGYGPFFSIVDFVV